MGEMRKEKIQGSKVLITGASSGIGKALAFEFAKKGSIVAIASRRINRLKEVAHDIHQSGPNIPVPVAVQCDITKRNEVKALIKTCVDKIGGIDILVNNAGIGVYGDTERTSVDDFRHVMEVNYFGSLYCIFETLPFMKRSGKGLIINIASVAAKFGVPYLGAYCSSKAALVAISQNLRIELAKSGISVAIVYPGYTQTEFFKNEKNVGGAHRPKGSYAPCHKVAGAVVKAIEGGKKEIVLSMEGKALTLFRTLFPGLVERAMEKIAKNLKEEVFNA